MDISQWPLGQIMQLPDHLFGRRFLVSAAIEEVQEAHSVSMSLLAFPERMVIWGVNICVQVVSVGLFRVTLRLGDQIPDTIAAFDTLDLLMAGFGGPEGGDFGHEFSNNQVLDITNIKHPVHTSGRRLIIEGSTNLQSPFRVYASVLISDIPRSIPDCLL